LTKNRDRRRLLALKAILVTVIAVVLGGCFPQSTAVPPASTEPGAQTTAPTPTGAVTVTVTASPVPQPSATAEPDGPGPSPIPSPSPETLPRPVELVRQDLAEHLGIPIDDVHVVEIKEVIWPDTCLGLPAPELCAPGETPGYQVTLLALGQEYVYHTDKNETFRYAGPGDVPRPP
jgi:hypothetical protein